MSVKGKPTFAPTHGKKGLAGLLLIAVICSVLSGCVNMNHQPFTNDYAVPEVLAPYKRIDTTPKTDWTALLVVLPFIADGVAAASIVGVDALSTSNAWAYV